MPKSKQQLIQAITEACVKANPGILDLKFGCRFQLKKGTKVVQYIYDTSWYEDDGLIKCRDNEDLYDESWTAKIIGREIGLPDVLLAIGKLGFISYKEGGRSSSENVSVDTKGRVMNENGMILFNWNLLKTLEDQSLPTLEFITSLLERE